MQPIDVVRLYTGRLAQAKIRYMVTGSVACVVYGDPRLTHDVDLVAEMSVDQIEALEGAFPEQEFYRPPRSVLTVDIQRAQRGSFNIIHHDTGFKADFYLAGRDSLSQWGLSQAKTIDLEGETISLAPPEYVVLRKLEFYREGGSEKHLRDIAGMLRRLPELRDSQDLSPRLDELGLIPQWQSALRVLDK